MTQQHITLAEILIDLEKELRELRLWEFETPSIEALSSAEPFSIDTLNFAQWLQFIFIPHLYILIEHKQPLPNTSGVKPMAEEYFQSFNVNSAPLISHLEKIDVLLSGK